MCMHDDSTLSLMIGVVFALVKIIEKGVTWSFEKWKGTEKNGAHTMVMLDPAASVMLAQISQKVEQVHEIVEKTDDQGTRLIYFPKSLFETHQKLDENIEKKVDSLAIALAGSKR